MPVRSPHQQPVERVQRFQRAGLGDTTLVGMGSVGRSGVGRAPDKLYPVFGLRAEKEAVRRTENPRVGGSIPPLATTPISMNRMGFSASPADHRRPRGQKTTDHRTFENRTRHAGR